MRFIVGLFFAAFICGITTAAAVAQSCVVSLRYAVATADPQTYAVGFGSFVDGVADLALTLYARDESYNALLPRTVVTRPGPPEPGTAKSWLSDPTYVTLPAGAAPLEAMALEIHDPDTHAPIACSGNHFVAADLGRTPTSKLGIRFPATQVTRSADIDRAVAAYAVKSPRIGATLGPRDAAPSCPKPYVDATLRKAVEPLYPEMARAQGHTGSALAVIELDSTGALLGTRLYRTSGWDELDAATLQAASKGTYSPEVFRCRPVPGNYLFEADFARH